jgi:dipeptide/tripeptide permease
MIKKLRKLLEGKAINLDSGFSMAFGLCIFSIGFGVMALALHLIPTGKISGGWMCLFYAILAVGELLIIPIAQAAIVEISPKNWRGFMMGIFFLLVSFASYISGWLGKLISPDSDTFPKREVYESLFTYDSLIVALFAVLFFSYGNTGVKSTLKNFISQFKVNNLRRRSSLSAPSSFRFFTENS